MKNDSVDKIVLSYFIGIAAEPFTYKGTLHPVHDLTVSPLLMRGYTCPANCGGCCSKSFSLDYLPSETHPYPSLPLRTIELNGKKVEVFSDTQANREGACKHLNPVDGRCGIHGLHPFSCDFELIRFFHTSETNSVRIATQLYGRGWNMMRVDGERGALCEIVPPTDETVADIIRKLTRLAQWAEHFGLAHRVDPIIQWARTKPTQPLVLKANPRPGLFT